MNSFALHPQLAKDCIEIDNLKLCKVLLMNDQNYPWLILVPRRAEICEIYELPPEEQALAWHETSEVGKMLMKQCQGDKLNIATLGNMVPQLHIHVVARFKSDPAWPKPIWGASNAKPYYKKPIWLEGLAKQLAIISNTT